MIKLKSIISESKELHKVTTDKDVPPFMTEEQWVAKWTKKSSVELNEQIFNSMKLTQEEIKSIRDIKPKLPLIKKLTAKLLSNRRFLYNKNVQKVFQNYLKTGELSKKDIADVFQEIRIMLAKVITFPALLALFLKVSTYILIAAPVVWTLAYVIGSQTKLVNIFMPKELTDEERDAAHEKINKKYNIKAKNKSLFKI